MARILLSSSSRYAHTWAETGQTTTEWLMVAGALTAVGIFLLRVLPSTIHKFSEALVYSMRTIAL